MVTGTEEIVGGEVDVQNSEDIAQQILGTGGGTQGQEDVSGLPEIPEEEVQPEAGAEQVDTETGEEGKVKPEEAKPEDTQDSETIKEAVERLNKLSGRKLSDEEAVEQLSDSYLKADAKIQSLSEQIRELVPYRQQYEALVSDPIISQILQGKNPFAQTGQETNLGDEDVSPAVQKVIGNLNQQIQTLSQKLQQLSGGMQTSQQMKISQEVAGYTRMIEDFAGKPENADFKAVLTDFREAQKINPYTSMPEKLKKLGAMMDNGVSIEEAWGVLNPDKIESRIKGKIAEAQKKKIGKGGITLKGKGKAPAVKDLSNAPEMSGKDFMAAIISNVKAQDEGGE